MLTTPPKPIWVSYGNRYGTGGEGMMFEFGRIAVGVARWNCLREKDGPAIQSYKAYMLLPGFKAEEQNSTHETMSEAKAWVEHHAMRWLIAAGLLKETAVDSEEPVPKAPERKTFKRPVVPTSAKPKLQRR